LSAVATSFKYALFFDGLVTKLSAVLLTLCACYPSA
jgi:hypothetical protein